MARVVVTGLGATTPIGNNVPSFFSGLLHGKSGIVDIREDSDLGSYTLPNGQVELAGLLPQNRNDGRYSEELGRRYDPQTLTLLLTAMEALEDARFSADNRASAILIGSAVGLRPTITRMRKAFPAYAQFSPELLPEPRYYGGNFLDEFSTSTVILAIAEQCIPRSIAYPFSTLCTSGGNAIILGYELIKAGLVDSALAIGFDFFHPRQNQVFSHFKLLDQGPIRPFDKKRSGYQLGESVGAVFLETAEAATARGVRPYSEIKGVGATSDGYHLVIPEPSGKPQLHAMMMALQEAGISAAELDVVAAIGRGSSISDQAEGRAIARLLGKLVDSTPMNSLIPNTGYTLGASSIMNFIALMVEMRKGVLFPTMNVEQIDSSLGNFDIVRGEQRTVQVRTALSLGSAFLGSNTAIVVRATDDERCAV